MTESVNHDPAIDAYKQLGADVGHILKRLRKVETQIHYPTSQPSTPDTIWPTDSVFTEREAVDTLPAASEYSAVALDAALPLDLELACHDFNQFDLSFQNEDLAVDHSLNTAIVISLFTHRFDELTQQGGYWGDGAASDYEQHMGSRLYCLQQSKPDVQTLRTAEDYAQESLKWLLDDQHLIELTVSATWVYHAKTHKLQLTVHGKTHPDSPYQSEFKNQFLLASG